MGCPFDEPMSWNTSSCAAMFSKILTLGGSDRVFDSIEFRALCIARLLFRRFLNMIDQKPQVHTHRPDCMTSTNKRDRSVRGMFHATSLWGCTMSDGQLTQGRFSEIYCTSIIVNRSLALQDTHRRYGLIR